MINLFIDTNIFLSFYHLTNEDLEELKKLVALIDTGQIHLMLPKQVKSEFIRNRGAKIADAMKKLQEAKFNISFPLFAKDYPDYDELRALMKQADKKHAELIAKIKIDAESDALNADKIVFALFGKSTELEVSEELVNKAVTRIRLGNPPGKNGSMGDAVNWECLLHYIPAGDEIHLISEDRDYRSQLTVGAFNEFLAAEWKEQKQTDVIFYPKLSDFFKAKFPSIKIASEVERDLLIKQLAGSGTFAKTHAVIAKLSKQTEFSTDQVEQLVKIAEQNNQVGWIAEDSDVHEFYASLWKKYGDKIQPDALADLTAFVEKGVPKEVEDDEVPF
jgi:predicted nucleic acid-binding protein